MSVFDFMKRAYVHYEEVDNYELFKKLMMELSFMQKGTRIILIKLIIFRQIRWKIINWTEFNTPFIVSKFHFQRHLSAKILPDKKKTGFNYRSQHQPLHQFIQL